MDLKINIHDIVDFIESVANEIISIGIDDLEIKLKDDHTPVSSHDLYVNSVLCEYFKKNFPNTTILSEEGPRNVSELMWVIDPINGTKSYITGGDKYNILISLVDRGLPVLGIVCHPLQNTTYFSQKGLGAFVKFGNQISRIEANSRSEPYRILLPSDKRYEKYVKVFNGSSEFILVDRSSLKVPFRDNRLHVVQGICDIYTNLGSGTWKTWDVCAGHAILNAVGGSMVDMSGEPISYYNSEGLIPNGFVAASDSIVLAKFLDWVGRKPRILKK